MRKLKSAVSREGRNDGKVPHTLLLPLPNEKLVCFPPPLPSLSPPSSLSLRFFFFSLFFFCFFFFLKKWGGWVWGWGYYPPQTQTHRRHPRWIWITSKIPLKNSTSRCIERSHDRSKKRPSRRTLWTSRVFSCENKNAWPWSAMGIQRWPVARESSAVQGRKWSRPRWLQRSVPRLAATAEILDFATLASVPLEPVDGDRRCRVGSWLCSACTVVGGDCTALSIANLRDSGPVFDSSDPALLRGGARFFWPLGNTSLLPESQCECVT